MTNALQVPTWPDPIDVNDFTNAYAVMFGFTIEATTSVYSVHINVYVSQAAYAAGKLPVGSFIYRSQLPNEVWDGVFPSFNNAIADPNFVGPLLSLRDWVYNTLKTNDPKFAGSTNL